MKTKKLLIDEYLKENPGSKVLNAYGFHNHKFVTWLIKKIETYEKLVQNNNQKSKN